MNFDNQCPICKSTEVIKKKIYFFDIPEILVNFIENVKRKRIKFSINYCKKCGNLFLHPRFTEEEYNIIFSNKDKPYLPFNISKELTLRSYLNHKFLKQFFNYNSDLMPKILDYGGAGGYMLIPFLKKFDCYLIDYTKYDLPENIQYLGRNLNNVIDKYKFEIIMALRVLEHVNDPLNLIKDFTRVISEYGIIYVQVPLGCLREWKSLDTPFRHINFFSEQSLYNLFRIAGLNIIHLKTKYYQFGGNPGWKIDIIGIKSKDHQKLKEIRFYSTTQQQDLKYIYYIPYIIKNRKFKVKDIKKILFILKNGIIRNKSKIIK
ncbi:MAG: class I SAM-dependent methyltransferase [Promethearchaeota archaeon]|jgi:hypothetical protein